MALFGKLFSKETCIVCGKEVGSLSRKRLSDGVICKDCAKRKLSPWFDDFKQSSTNQVLAQIARRDERRVTLPGSFQVTRVLGESDVILLDEAHGSFCVLADAGRRSFSRIEDALDLNPDVFTVDQVESVTIDAGSMSSRELKRSVNGEQVSYNPRRYEYPCNVTLNVRVDDPFVSAMSIRLNPSTINIQTEGERIRNRDVRSAGQMTADWLLGNTGNVRDQAEAWADDSLAARLTRPVEQALRNPADSFPDYAYGFKCSRENWPRIQEFGRYVQMAELARAFMTS